MMDDSFFLKKNPQQSRCYKCSDHEGWSMVNGHHVCWPRLVLYMLIATQAASAPLRPKAFTVIKASFSVMQHLIELQMSLNERGEQHAPPHPPPPPPSLSPVGLNKRSESMGSMNFSPQMMSSSLPHYSSRVNELDSLGLILSFPSL